MIERSETIDMTMTETEFIIKSNNTIYIPTIYRGDCKVMSIESLKVFSNLHNFTNGIPRILHYISNEEDIAKAYTGFYKNCGKINKDMRFVLWTDASFYRVFITQFNKKIIEDWKMIFSNLNDYIRITIIRAMVLHTFGGVSLSLDTVCQKSINDIAIKDNCFVNIGNTMKANIEFNRDNDYGESVFGCIKHHPFTKLLINNPKGLKTDRYYFSDYLDLYNKNQNQMVKILDETIAEQILPKLEMEKICNKTQSGTKQISACQSLKTYKPMGLSKAVLVHQPVYGISSVQIVADDACYAGLPVHIVIV